MHSPLRRCLWLPRNTKKCLPFCRHMMQLFAHSSSSVNTELSCKRGRFCRYQNLFMGRGLTDCNVRWMDGRTRPDERGRGASETGWWGCFEINNSFIRPPTCSNYLIRLWGLQLVASDEDECWDYLLICRVCSLYRERKRRRIGDMPYKKKSPTRFSALFCYRVTFLHLQSTAQHHIMHESRTKWSEELWMNEWTAITSQLTLSMLSHTRDLLIIIDVIKSNWTEWMANRTYNANKVLI